ncbi:MAG TPA: thymidine phosphorylase, partial [Candidatus Nanoarchaeia archaeon]|nr:thymidine phosphorylase [Candidatus Nanoarchaeia archaeon]
IDNLVISHLARIAGTPLDKGAGLYLNKHVGEQISKGEVLYTVYAENEFKLKSTIALLKKNDGYLVK